MKKITDKQRLDWLEENSHILQESKTGHQLTFSDGRYIRAVDELTVRQAIDAAIRAEIKGMK